MEKRVIKKPARGEFIFKALTELAADKKWRIIDHFRYEDLIWEEEGVDPPTKEVVEAKADELEAQFDATMYRDQRALEYPSIGDQLDALFKAGAFPPEMAATIQAVKDKYPKS